MEVSVSTRTKKRILFYAITLFMLIAWGLELNSQNRIRDMVSIRDAGEKELIGYGLVTGLDQTGDRTIRRQGAAFTVQSIANMLQNFGVNIDPDNLRTRNVAAVMVTARLNPFQVPGSKIDVTVSSLGDASSLVGGVLLQTPLIDPNDPDYQIRAQGPLVVGGIEAETPGANVRQNQTTTGRVPYGGSVERNRSFQFSPNRPLGLALTRPDNITARNIAKAVNEFIGEDLASVEHAGLVEIQWPEILQNTNELNGFVASILELEVERAIPSRVVINERTGTIVAGGNIRITQVLVSHGNVQIRTRQQPFVSQPQPLSPQGQTIVGSIPVASLEEQESKTFVLEENTNVQELAASLNALGLSPRDIIAIFQAIDQAGALQGELVIM